MSKLLEHEIEIIKAFSNIWRKNADHIPFYVEDKDAEGFIGGDDPIDYFRLSDEEKNALSNWIDWAFDFDENGVYPESSYSLKHVYEGFTKNYITNGQFKGAMIHYGYDPINPREQNCHYRIKIFPEILDEFKKAKRF